MRSSMTCADNLIYKWVSSEYQNFITWVSDKVSKIGEVVPMFIEWPSPHPLSHGVAKHHGHWHNPVRENPGGLLLDIPSPGQDNSYHRKDYGVPQGNQQSVRSIHRHKGRDAKGIGFELSRYKYSRHCIEIRPQKIGRDIQPEVAASDAESERQEDEAAESVSRKPAQRSAQAERERTSHNGHSCG